MENYLRDVLYELIEEASLRKQEIASLRMQETDTEFEMGILQGYYEDN